MEKHFTQKYLEAFPFSEFTSLEDSSKFLYMYEREGEKKLYLFDREKHSSLEEGELFSNIDFNMRSCRPLRVLNDKLYLISDRDNQENFNIFSIDVKTKEINQITSNEYTACIHITDEGIAFFSSRQKNEVGLFRNDIYSLDLSNGESKFIINDEDDEYRVGWGRVIPSKNKEYLILNVDRNNERTNNNFSLVNIKEGTKEVIIPKEFESGLFYLLENEVDTEVGFYFVSDKSGYENLYYYDFIEKKVLKLTNVNYLTDGFDYNVSEGIRYFISTIKRPNEGKTSILTYKEEFPGQIRQLDCDLTLDGEISFSTYNKDFIWIGESHHGKLQREVYIS
ncbi:DPP IV N-terminal domain-containing protein [Halobacteriovorax sp. JY17]|uniref:DPP IV N-terminal domain-containing protein n=1 Tax=Halobacteriovorax sp. JY17 TaxID=2014617 RepID=UPI000C611AAB|nr:DPP IV N-terminal domain-containing protein [Halobacteriovorax sp. JY17]PIK13773.1 MAG: hypothetical protein CES88_12350 [Halobacteriovorax sp. JY17]